MAVERNIGGDGDLFVGEDKTLYFQGTTPMDCFGWDLLFDVRLHDSSPSFILQKHPSCVAGVLVVPLTDDDMNLFQARTYRYSLKRMNDASEQVLYFGDFAPEKATAP